MASTRIMMMVNTRDTLNLTERRDGMANGGMERTIGGIPRRRVDAARTRRAVSIGMLGRATCEGRGNASVCIEFALMAGITVEFIVLVTAIATIIVTLSAAGGGGGGACSEIV